MIHFHVVLYWHMLSVFTETALTYCIRRNRALRRTKKMGKKLNWRKQ
jgi:hypothetical protein